MNSSNHIKRSFCMLFLLFLSIVTINAQELGPNDISPNTEDVRCIEKNYRHKTDVELARMTPEELIDEDSKHWNYHVGLMDEYGMFKLNSYSEKIGVAIIPVLSKIAIEFRSRPLSKCQQERFFNAFAIAADVDEQTVRLRSSEQGRTAIRAAYEAVRAMKEAGLGKTTEYTMFPFGLHLLDQVYGTNDNDNSMRELLASEYSIKLSEEEFVRFVEFLTSQDPTYPSWTPRIDMSRDFRKNKKKYHDAYLEFKKKSKPTTITKDQ